MIAKCFNCGFVTKFPFQARHRFRFCYRCKGSLDVSFSNDRERFLFNVRK